MARSVSETDRKRTGPVATKRLNETDHGLQASRCLTDNLIERFGSIPESFEKEPSRKNRLKHVAGSNTRHGQRASRVPDFRVNTHTQTFQGQLKTESTDDATTVDPTETVRRRTRKMFRETNRRRS